MSRCKTRTVHSIRYHNHTDRLPGCGHFNTRVCKTPHNPLGNIDTRDRLAYIRLVFKCDCMCVGTRIGKLLKVDLISQVSIECVSNNLFGVVKRQHYTL